MEVSVTQFSGGKTNYSSGDAESVKGISKYLLALCGKYAKAAEDILKPKISLINSSNRYDFGNQNFFTFSAPKIFDISTSNLNGGVNLTFTSLKSDFQISKDNVSWGSAFNVTINDSIFFSRVYVRSVPLSAGQIKGELVINNGSVSKIIYLSGRGV